MTQIAISTLEQTQTIGSSLLYEYPYLPALVFYELFCLSKARIPTTSLFLGRQVDEAKDWKQIPLRSCQEHSLVTIFIVLVSLLVPHILSIDCERQGSPLQVGVRLTEGTW